MQPYCEAYLCGLNLMNYSMPIKLNTFGLSANHSTFALHMLQFNPMKGQGTRIIVYNLWEDDQGLLELDFDADPHVPL